MKLAIFVDQFPVRSQTFVLNQITGLLDLGVDVSVLSLTQGDASIFDDVSLKQYNLIARTNFMLNSDQGINKGKAAKLFSRLITVVKGLFFHNNRAAIIKACDVNCFGQQAKSLLLASIVARNPKPLTFDVIVAHFGFNGVTANQLRDLGVLKGKMVTIFHGHDISSTQTLARHSKNYQKIGRAHV